MRLFCFTGFIAIVIVIDNFPLFVCVLFCLFCRLCSGADRACRAASLASDSLLPPPPSMVLGTQCSVLMVLGTQCSVLMVPMVFEDWQKSYFGTGPGTEKVLPGIHKWNCLLVHVKATVFFLQMTR